MNCLYQCFRQERVPYSTIMTEDRISLDDDVSEKEETANFQPSAIHYNPNGWGAYKYIPRGASEIQSTCFHCKETTLRLVITTTLKKSRFQCLFDSSFFRQNPGILRGRRNERGRGALSRKEQAKGLGRQGLRHHQNEPPFKIPDTSITVSPEWRIIKEMDFPSLAKLSLPDVKDGEDILCCGSLEYYDKTYDTVNVKSEKPLQKICRFTHNITTTEDPIICSLADLEGNIYATDTILATIMCCTRSNYSWDIVITKIGDKLFFDKRTNVEIDFLTVNENSVKPPKDDRNPLNSRTSLATEATYINHNFSLQVLKSNESKYKFEMGNPFISDEEKRDFASVAYRYRKWDLKNGNVLVARCEHDAVMQGPNNETQFLTIKSLNEWNSKLSTGVEWRQKLDTERGAVLETELLNNAYKLAKWTVQALLAGSDQLKFGYVSRAKVTDATKHVILGTEQYKPNEFATKMNLSMDNAWGILRAIIDVCRKREDGKYLILKDPKNPIIRLYNIPFNTFVSEDDEDEEEDDDEPVNDAFQVIA